MQVITNAYLTELFEGEEKPFTFRHVINFHANLFSDDISFSGYGHAQYGREKKRK